MLNWTTISSSSMHVHTSYLCLDQQSSPMAQEIRYMRATFIYSEILRMLVDIHGVQLRWPTYIEHWLYGSLILGHMRHYHLHVWIISSCGRLGSH
ncbi:hypothetical protein QJS04_geneDACA020126 [Acorus gramineus]|uniref:Uncharacterized protein n=1 Tax=Acorus gramineus TaxID=55184 RepID=A0AAV8ZZY3_ACOGR|nr:hypothetical protein QJS04_geneDACA020126 [Acorus gramineus]